jgi:glucose-1-phosphate thymidylyltransferase
MRSPARPPVIGIVPAAGRATRLPDRTCSKELIHVGDRAIGDYLVSTMTGAGADHISIVIAPDKQDLVEHFGLQTRDGIPISYVEQPEPTGMSDAIDLAYPRLRNATVLMGMPDTIVHPEDSLPQLRAAFERSGADIALALAPTDEPERLGPVDVDADGRVVRVLDKPRVPPHNMVWTVACWNARFTEYLHAYLAAGKGTERESPLGLIFEAARQDGFHIQSLAFPDGRYIDAGTLAGLAQAKHFVARLVSQQA